LPKSFCVFSCFPKTLKYDLGYYAMRLTSTVNERYTKQQINQN